MTKAALLATTAIVWTLGFGAAAALIYDVTRPFSSPPIAIADGVPAGAGDHASVVTQEPRVIVLPPAHILAQRQQPAVMIHTRSPAAVKRHCSDWRPLQQGYASVQVCE